jgi:hypothetical protein
MSVRWVRNKRTGYVLDVPGDHWCLTHADFEEVPNPYATAEPDPEMVLPATAYADLPTDFPARDVLREHGYETIASLDGLTQAALQRLRGIGPARARAILEARATLIP